MDFFSRINPAYKSVTNQLQAAPQPAATGGLSGLFGSLLGRVTPAYRTVDGGAYTYAPASSGVFSMFSASPSYKTAPAASVADDADVACVADDDASDIGPDQVVVL